MPGSLLYSAAAAVAVTAAASPLLVVPLHFAAQAAALSPGIPTPGAVAAVVLGLCAWPLLPGDVSQDYHSFGTCNALYSSNRVELIGLKKRRLAQGLKIPPVGISKMTIDCLKKGAVESSEVAEEML